MAARVREVVWAESARDALDAVIGYIAQDSPQAAMQAAKGQAAESDRILAFGSFYTVAGALEALRKKP